jgi:hypothetical protein
MARTNKGLKLFTSTEAGDRLQDSVSKTALVEAYLAALAVINGACDTPPTIAQVRMDINPVLEARGDRLIRD